MSGPMSAWTCPICGEWYVVPSRAKDCEARCREIVWAERGGRPNGVMNADVHSYGSGGQHG